MLHRLYGCLLRSKIHIDRFFARLSVPNPNGQDAYLPFAAKCSTQRIHMSHISISTTQYDISSEPVLEEAPAAFRIINGSVYIFYESDTDEPKNSAGEPHARSAGSDFRTIIRINEKSLEVRREGSIRGKLIYVSGETTASRLDLGFSFLEIMNRTRSVTMLETDASLSVSVRYDLFINGQFISDCVMDILLSK